MRQGLKTCSAMLELLVDIPLVNLGPMHVVLAYKVKAGAFLLSIHLLYLFAASLLLHLVRLVPRDTLQCVMSFVGWSSICMALLGSIGRSYPSASAIAHQSGLLSPSFDLYCGNYFRCSSAAADSCQSSRGPHLPYTLSSTRAAHLLLPMPFWGVGGLYLWVFTLLYICFLCGAIPLELRWNS